MFTATTTAIATVTTAAAAAMSSVGSSVERPFFGGIDCCRVKRTRGLSSAYPRLAVNAALVAFRAIGFVAVASAASAATAAAAVAISAPASIGTVALSFLLHQYRLRRLLLSLPPPFPSFYTSYSFYSP